MQRGYIKLYRKSVENPLFKKPLIWHYFEYCLLKANHKDIKMIWNSKEIIIEEGSFITGRKQAADDTGLSEQNIRTAINTLTTLKMLFKNSEKSTSKFTYLTVCNYGDYQGDKKEANQQPTSNQPASNQQVTTNKNEQTLLNTNDNKKIYVENSDEFRLANFLYQNILKNKPDFKKPNLQIWSKDADRMLRIDKRNIETSKNLITWIQNDDFEQSNVLSIAKLRKRFDSLEIKMNKPSFKKTESKSLSQIVEERRQKNKPDFDIEIKAEG